MEWLTLAADRLTGCFIVWLAQWLTEVPQMETKIQQWMFAKQVIQAAKELSIV